MRHFMMALFITCAPDIAQGAVTVDLELPAHHVGDDPFPAPGWMPLDGPLFSIDFQLEVPAAADATLSWQAHDVESGIDGVADTILWDGQLVRILFSTPQDPPNAIVFHPQASTVDRRLLTVGPHTLTFAAGRNTRGELDDFEFRNVRLEYESGILGDMDIDGDVDFDDIGPFTLGLNDAPFYTNRYGVPPELYGDMDASGQHDFDDVIPFAAILETNQLRAVPEPTALVLVVIYLTCGVLVPRGCRRAR
ncbi:MAG: hypothetical protein ACC645_11540 [Pirellulales bacterium]